MRRYTALIVALLLVLTGCTDDEDDPSTADGTGVDDGAGDEEEEVPVQGLRVGVVLPPADTAVADEVDDGTLGLDELAERLDDEVHELRTLVPDSDAFVADLAVMLAVEGYDLVCVLGRGAEEAVTAVAARHAGTTFCATPVATDEEQAGNVVAVDLAIEELGHVVGVALSALGGPDPVALLGTGDRAGGEAFRGGLRAGVGDTPLQEVRGSEEELEAELEAAVEDEVAALAFDVGPAAAPLLEDGIGMPVLAPAPVLDSEDGAMRWRVRWDRVLEHVLRIQIDEDAVLPERLGLRHEVFEIQLGPQASATMVDAVEQAMGELEREERDALAPPPGADEDEDDGDE